MTALSAKGTNGTLHFDGSFVTLERSGAGRILVGKGTKRIPVHAITAVQFKPAGLVGGYIAFTLAGGHEVRSRFGSASSDAQSDENSITFHVRQRADMALLRDAIEAAVAALQSHGTSVPAQSAQDPGQRLARVRELLDAGAITPAEYEEQRARILADI